MDDLRRADWSGQQQISGLASSYRARYGEPVWRVLLSLLDRRRYRRVIDLGCGPGLFLADAAQRLGAEMLVGLDASVEMLETARQVLSRMAPEQDVMLVCHDLDAGPLPLRDAHLDLVFSGYLLHELDRPEMTLRSVSSVLVDGGLCVSLDYVSGNEESFVKAMVALGMDEGRARSRYPHMCSRSAADIVHLFEAAGLTDIRHVMVNGHRAIVLGTNGSH